MGFFSKAVSRLDELKRNLVKEPGSHQFLALAEEYRKAGKTREMIESLERGLAHHPNYVAGHVALGRAYRQAGRPDDSLKAYLAAIKIDRENLVAIRQAADIYLEKGERVEAIKKLKLYRALSPGDREVNEKIEWLDSELAAAARPKPGPRVDTWPAIAAPPPSRSARQPVPPPPSAREAPPVAPPPPPPVPVVLAQSPLAPPEPPVEAALGAAPRTPAIPIPPPPPTEAFLDAVPERIRELEPVPRVERDEAATPQGAVDLLELTYDRPGTPPATRPAASPPEAMAPLGERLVAGAPDLGRGERAEELVTLDFGPEPGSVEGSGAAVAGSEAPFEVEVELEPETAPEEEAPATAPPSAGSAAPLVTETLAELYRSQGHLADARQAYVELARRSDPAQAREFLERAGSIPVPLSAEAAVSRLRVWAEQAAGLVPENAESGMDDVLRGVVGAGDGAVDAAVLTDLEGLPVVAAGRQSGAAAQEVLVAELTAFCKGLGRTEGDVGVGRLSSLAVASERGTVAVASVAEGYALVLRTGPGYPIGRLRYQAERAASRLRPMLA